MLEAFSARHDEVVGEVRGLREDLQRALQTAEVVPASNSGGPYQQQSMQTGPGAQTHQQQRDAFVQEWERESKRAPSHSQSSSYLVDGQRYKPHGQA